MAANRKNKLSTKRKRGANSPSLGSLAGGIKDGKAEGSPEGHAARIPAQTAEKTQQVVERQKPGEPQDQTPVLDGVTAELVRLRQSLAQHWPVYNNWTNLSDLPMVNTCTAVNKSQGLKQEHGTCSIGETSFKWLPLPPPCKICMKRKRVDLNPELLKDTERISRRVNTFQSGPTCTVGSKQTQNTSIKQQSTTISSLHSKETLKNMKSMTPPKTTLAGDTKRKMNLQENEMKETPKVTHGQKVSSATELDSLKSQRAIKMDGLKQSMNTEATRDQPKDQAIRVRGPEGGGRRLASQTGALKTFQPGEKPTGRITKGRPTRVAPLFKQPAASTLQRNVGAGPSTSKVQLKDGPEELKGGRGEAGSLRSCPMCQEEFPPGMSQLDMDGHIAACLSASSEDIMW
ncbi:uncharacterized protein LOC144925069 [Branchiostoma floridae x Branchiostoma belcheri]